MSVSLNGTNGLTFADSTTQNTGGYTGFRNRIINGAMMIDQRNAGSAATGIVSSVYTVDRWRFAIGGTGTFTAQQSSTAPAGFSNSLSLSCTTAAATPAVLYVEQRVEGFNLQDLAYNTASAASISASFWVRSNKTGTFVVLLYNTSASRMVGRTYTISSANTWEQKTVTFPGDTASAIPNSNASGLEVRFWLAAGTSWSSGTLPSSWAADVTANEAAGQTVNLADTIGNTFYITGVQLEKGSVATPFEFRPYGTELQLCQRYYETGGSTYRNSGIGGVFSVPYVVKKRASATLTATGNYYASAEAVGRVFGTGGDALASFYIENTGNFTGAVWTASAEL